MSDPLGRDRRFLIGHLFAEATSALENAQAIATRGQSHRLTAEHYVGCATRLEATIDDAAALTAAIHALIKAGGADADG